MICVHNFPGTFWWLCQTPVCFLCSSSNILPEPDLTFWLKQSLAVTLLHFQEFCKKKGTDNQAQVGKLRLFWKALHSRLVLWNCPLVWGSNVVHAKPTCNFLFRLLILVGANYTLFPQQSKGLELVVIMTNLPYDFNGVKTWWTYSTILYMSTQK